MALIGSINHGYDTDVCCHYTLNDIMPTNDSGVHFCFFNSVEVSSPLKVVSFIELVLRSIELYEAYWCMWVFTE